jgi:CysZ protein
LLKEIIIAIQSYYQAHKFIVRNKLWKWILIPGVIYAVLFVTGMYYWLHTWNFVLQYFSSHTGIINWLERQENGWLRFLFIFGQLILHLILILAYFSWFKYFILIIGSPVFAFLSEKTACLIEGKDIPFSLTQYLKDVARGITIAFRNAFWQTLYTFSIIILCLIPVVGWATPVLALFVECYYLGFSMLDYSCERKKLKITHSIHFIAQNKGLAIGNGIVFYLMHGVVIIGWVLAPSYSVIAATLSMHQPKRTKRYYGR